jgi:hypothetical protein
MSTSTTSRLFGLEPRAQQAAFVTTTTINHPRFYQLYGGLIEPCTIVVGFQG